MRVYLDNGATTPVAKEVVDAMLPYYTEFFGNASSIHQFGRETHDALEKAREVIAKKINASAEEIIFTSGGTEADNLAVKGMAYARKELGNHIITSKIEHHAVLHSCEQLEKEGFRVTYLDVDNEGFIDLEQLKDSITDKTILVTIIHANNEIGTIEPIEEIGKIAEDNKVPFHTDAVQSLTKIPLDVKKQNLTLASFSAHKIHGPKGIGALYLRGGTKIQKLSDGGSHEHKLRAGTENLPSIVGFAKAVEIAKEKYVQDMVKLRDRIITSLLEIPDTHLNGPTEERLCNNASISFHFIEGESLLMHLDMGGIAVSTGSACSSHELKPSHVLTAIGLKPEIAHGTIRFTVGRENTDEEITYAIESTKEAVKKLRKISPLSRR